MVLSLENYAVLPHKNCEGRLALALSSIVARYGGRVLNLCDGRASVRVSPDGGPVCNVFISDTGADILNVRVCENQDGIRSQSTAARNNECQVLNSIVVAASIDWLFHCHVTSNLRSPLLYTLPTKRLPLTSIFATSSGITNAQRALLIPSLQSLGAEFSPDLEERCTHLIVQCGSPVTSAKVTACSKDPLCHYVWIVTSAWLSACQVNGCRVAESQYLLPGMKPPTFFSADVWLDCVARNLRPDIHTRHQVRLYKGDGIALLPPSSLFLDDKPQNVCNDNQQQLQRASTSSSKTQGWWINEASADLVTIPLTPMPFSCIKEMMSMSSSEIQSKSQEIESSPNSQTNSLMALEELEMPSPLAACKGNSMSPASSMSASRTNPGKRRDGLCTSDVMETSEVVFTEIESLLEERLVRRGDLSFSEFLVKWLGLEVDTWVPECDIDPELIKLYRAQHPSDHLLSSSPCMFTHSVTAAEVASSFSSSSGTKYSTGRKIVGKRSKAGKSSASSTPIQTPVYQCDTAQKLDSFTSPSYICHPQSTETSENLMSSGTVSNLAAASYFHSPNNDSGVLFISNGIPNSLSNQSPVQASTSSITSTQLPNSNLTTVMSQKSSISVEFPPSFPHRLSQQDPYCAPKQNFHNVMDIGDYCVGMLPSLCLMHNFPRQNEAPSIVKCPSAVDSVVVSLQQEFNQHASNNEADDRVPVDSSARKRRRVSASRNLGRIIVSLMCKDDVMYSNSYLSSLGACLSDVNCGAFDILVTDSLRASKKLICALAGGKWIVSPEFLHASKRQGVLIQPDAYEYYEDEKPLARGQKQRNTKRLPSKCLQESSVEQLVQVSFAAPRYWRQQQQRAFDGLIFCVDVNVLPSRSIMTSILTCGGATIAESLTRMEQLARNRSVGFIVRPSLNSNECESRMFDCSSDAPSRWTNIFDMDILLGLCQPLQHPLLFCAPSID